MGTCNTCGRENEDRYKFCLGCGAPLSASRPAPKRSEAGPLPVISSGSTSAVDAAVVSAPAPVVQESHELTVPLLEPEPAAAPRPVAVPEPVVVPRPVVVAPEPVIAPRSAGLECTKCGTPIPPDFAFCGRCGTRVEQPEPETQLLDGPGFGTVEEVDTQMTTPVRGRLVLIKPDGTEGEAIALVEGENVFGRHTNNATLADDEYLSPQHLKITCTGASTIVEDAGSLNGVYLRLTDIPQRLRHNDMIRVGQELLRFSEKDQLNAILVGNQDTRVQGSPEFASWGVLHLQLGPRLETNVYVLHGKEQTIGREVGTILFREDGFVSGRHARLSPTLDGGAQLQDLGSSNGTYVRLREPHVAQDGDFLLIGQQLFHLHVMG